jgi:anti-sigma factor RsiW
MRCADCQDAINAYIDDELMPDERSDMQAHLASCVDCRREHDVLAATSRTLKEGLVRHRAPDVLKARIRSALAQPTAFDRPLPLPQRSWVRLAAAGVMIAAASSALTFGAMERPAAQHAATADVLTSHIRSLMPGHLLDIASTDQHNVKPWFNGRLDLSPSVPRLDSIGFPLLGGRIDYVSGRSVAAVVYGRRQHVINVFSWPTSDAAPLAPSVSTQKGYHIVHWRNEGMEMWAVSDLNAGELEQFVARFEETEPLTGHR